MLLFHTSFDPLLILLRLKIWTSKLVAGFVSSVPRLNCDLAVLEAKITAEELTVKCFF